MKIRRSLVLLGLVLVAVPACKKASESSAEKAAERAIERATGNKADVNISGEAVKITGKEGGEEFSYEVSGKGGVALPKSFPEDVPRYPGAVVLSSMSQGNAMSMVTLQTGDAPERVYEFYGAKLRGGGWDIANEVSAGQMRMISGRKEERQANITVIGGEAKCTITVVYSDDKG
ncbi:MAG: hypothetical protein ACYC9Y_15875 [Candidatus Methylomirabilia bacterium]